MSKKIAYIIAALVVIALAVVYTLFDPAEHSWFPGCLIEWVTGFECPACGMQRMAHALLHGDITTALLLNPFMLVVVLPVITLIAIAWVAPQGRLEWLKRLVSHPITLILLFAVMMAWWVVRNTDLWHNFIAAYN
jgi:ABC-type Na+ efflux pump permease subunit